MNIRYSLVTTAVLGTTLAGAVAAPATASGGDAIITTGSCSGSADWKMKAKIRDGRIEFEGEVDSNKNGQVWSWKIKHNGTVSARGKATTSGASGSFTVRRKLVDLAGTDALVFRAVHQATGQVCRGTLSI